MIIPLDKFYDKSVIEEVLSGKRNMGWQGIRKIGDNSIVTENENVLTTIRPIPVNMVSKKAIIFINNRSNFLDDIITKISLTKDAGIRVYSENWQPITSYGEDSFILDETYKSLATNKAGYTVRNIDNKDYYLFYHNSAAYNWKYIVNIPAKSINDRAELVRRITLWVCAVLFTIAFFISYLFSSSIRKKVDIIEDKNKNLEDLLEQNKPLMKNAFLKNLLNGRIDSKNEVLEKFSYYGMAQAQGMYCVCINAYIENYNDYIDSYNEKQKASYSIYISNLIDEFINGKYHGFVFENDFNEFAIVVNFIDESDITKIDTEIKEIAENIYKLFINNTKFNIFIGIGEAVYGIHNIHQSYLQAKEALSNRWRIIDNIIYFSSLNGSIDNVYSYFGMLEEKLVSVINNKDKQGCTEIIEEFKTWLVKYYINENNEDVNYVFIQVIAGLTKIMYNQGYNVYEVLYRRNLFESLNTAGNLTEKMDMLHSYAISCIDYINSLQTNKNSRIILKVQEYIKENFSKEDLNLEEIAANVYLSPQYVSKLFKEETGENIKEYIIRIRIDKAKESLLNTNKRIIQIAEEVGYGKVQTFTKIFKKYEGKTPGEYRESNQTM